MRSAVAVPRSCRPATTAVSAACAARTGAALNRRADDRPRSLGRSATATAQGWTADHRAPIRLVDAARPTRSSTPKPWRRQACTPVHRRKLARQTKQPYNGADGLPIREEIVERHGTAVVTPQQLRRRCLNIAGRCCSRTSTMRRRRLRRRHRCSCSPRSRPRSPVARLVVALRLCGWPSRPLTRLRARRRPVPAVAVARRAVRNTGAAPRGRYAHQHPDWGIRVYRRPGCGCWSRTGPCARVPPGRLPSPQSAPIRCARMYAATSAASAPAISAKPWRIGISAHLKPRPGVIGRSPPKTAAALGVDRRLTNARPRPGQPAPALEHLVRPPSTRRSRAGQRCTTA